MNILIITSLYPAYHGHSVKEISYAIHNVVKEIKRINGYNIRVFRPIYIPSKNIEKYQKHYILDEVDIYNKYLLKLPKTNIIFKRDIIFDLKKDNYIPNIVISEMPDSYRIGLYVAKYFSAKFIIALNQSDLSYIMKSSKSEKFLFSSYKIICRSWQIQNKLSKYMPKYKDKMFVGYFGIDENEIEDEQFIIKRIDSWKSKTEINFVSACLLQKLKNIDINVQALSKLKDVNWKYTIIGDGEERKSIENIIHNYGLEERITILGMLDRQEVLKLLKKSDIFLMVSAPETFGLAYLEAMAKGNIVFCSKGWGIDGAIIDGENGFLVEPKNAEQLYMKICKFLNLEFSYKAKLLLNSYKTVKMLTNRMAAENFLKNIAQ